MVSSAVQEVVLTLLMSVLIGSHVMVSDITFSMDWKIVSNGIGTVMSLMRS